MNRRVLVTGGCGFVGVPLVRHLAEQGDDVVVYDDMSRGTPSRLDNHVREQVRVVQGDVRDLDLLMRVLRDHQSEAVVHLAAVHFIPDCDADPERCLSVNIGGTQTVLDAIRLCESVSCLVYASTAAVYAPDNAPHKEDLSRLAPTDVYGFSKLAGEQLVEAFARHGDVSSSIARLFNVFGPLETNPHLIPTVIRQAEQGRRLLLGNLSTRRDYVFTEDVARALALFVDATYEGAALLCNVGTGQPFSGEEVVKVVSGLLGKDLIIERDEGRVRPSDRPMLRADNARARQSLSWSPRVSLEDGLLAALAKPVGPGVSWR